MRACARKFLTTPTSTQNTPTYSAYIYNCYNIECRCYLGLPQLWYVITHIDLSNPHIVQFLGVYFDLHAPVLVMEYLPTTLVQSLDKYGVLANEISFSILRDVTVGLRYLHERDEPIIHRDLSANNVLLTADMRAKISDLGVAKILQMSPVQQQTMSKTPGTSCYMPPEAMSDKPRYDSKVYIAYIHIIICALL